MQLSQDVEADTDTFRKAATKNLRSTFSMEGVEKGAESVRMFGTELEAVEFKMSKIKEQGLNLSSIHGDPKEIQKLSEEYQKLTIEHDKLSQAANARRAHQELIKNFVSAQLIVWAIRKVFQLLTQGLKDASNAAAEAEQVFGRFDAVFGGLTVQTPPCRTWWTILVIAKSSAADILSTIGNTALGFGASAREAAQFSETVPRRFPYHGVPRCCWNTIRLCPTLHEWSVGKRRELPLHRSVVRESRLTLSYKRTVGKTLQDKPWMG
jgi:hypothetical protein